MSMRLHLITMALLLVLPPATAQSPQEQADPAKLSPSGAYSATEKAPAMTPERKQRMVLKETSPGVWQMEKIRIDALERSISFPVGIGETKAQLEYLLVNGKGKTHESLFITDVFPAQLHVAARLLSVENGHPVNISVQWKVAAPKKSIPIANLLNIQGAAGKQPQWKYHANQLADGSLSAEMDQSLITLIDDPNALIHHLAAKELNRDDIYTAKQSDPSKPPLLPAKGLPLTMTLTFPKVEK